MDRGKTTSPRAVEKADFGFIRREVNAIQSQGFLSFFFNQDFAGAPLRLIQSKAGLTRGEDGNADQEDVSSEMIGHGSSMLWVAV
jgi:hypothetical protein